MDNLTLYITSPHYIRAGCVGVAFEGGVMARGEKVCCGGMWTEARMNQFIMGALRKAHVKWGPANKSKQKARVRHGFYLCAGCKEEVPATIPSVYKSGKKAGKPYRKENAAIDHRDPVVDPAVGLTSWDEVIKRMFVEMDEYDILCDACHSIKTKEEGQIRAERKRK